MLNQKPASKLYDAGFVQRREWMLYKIRPDHYPLNIATDFIIDSFDPLVVQKVINLMVEKYEILRTTLRVVDGSLRQIIHDPDKFPVHFDYFDIKDKPEAEKFGSIKEKMNVFSNAPFNFEFGPAFRMVVFEITPKCFSIHFVFHHLISDEHSLKLFTNDLGEMQKLVSQNLPCTPVGDNIQYKKYSAFENELLETDKGDKHRKYWKETLVNGIPDLSIIDKSRLNKYNLQYLRRVDEVKEKINQLPCFDERFLPSVIRRYQSDAAGQIKLIFSHDLFKKIKKYKEERKNGLLALFVGGLLLTFHKLSGQTLFAFDIPGSSRANRDFQQTIGWLTSGGPCFFDIDGYFSTDLLLDYIDKQLYFLSKHCIYPFEAVGCGSMPPLGGRMPVFLTLSYASEDNNSDDNGIISHEPKGYHTFQDIAFFFTSFNNTVTLDIIYNNFLFNPELVEQIVEENLVALDGILNADLLNKTSLQAGPHKIH
jgi:Condensation domain